MPDATKLSFADILTSLAMPSADGDMQAPDAALVHYPDGWRLIARFKGLGEAHRITAYTVDPEITLKNFADKPASTPQ